MVKKTSKKNIPAKGPKPKILDLPAEKYEPTLLKYVSLSGRDIHFVGGKATQGYHHGVEEIYTFLLDFVFGDANDHTKMLAILIYELMLIENNRIEQLDLRLNTAPKLQHGIEEITEAIRLFEMSALNIEGIRFTVRRSPYDKKHNFKSAKEFNRTRNPINLSVVTGFEAVNLLMSAISDRKAEFQEMLRRFDSNRQLKKQIGPDEKRIIARIARRFARNLFPFIRREMKLNKKGCIDAIVKILNALELLPPKNGSNKSASYKNMRDRVTIYLKK